MPRRRPLGITRSGLVVVSHGVSLAAQQALSVGRVATMRRVVVDSNAMDPLMDLFGAYDAVRAAVDKGDLEILFTHVTVEELAAIPDYERRCRLLIFLIDLGRLVPTGAFIVGASRLDFGRPCDDDESVRLLMGQGVTHVRDALIGATALVDGCALVTHDSRLTGRARERGVEVLTTDDLLAELGFHAAHSVQPIPKGQSNYRRMAGENPRSTVRNDV